MATHVSKMYSSKPSFATIAAMAPPTQISRSPVVREEGTAKVPDTSAISTKSNITDSPSGSQLQRDLRNSMSRLAVREKSPTPSPSIDQETTTTNRAGLRYDDDQTQVSSSSTKPASLDGKSATSGTTFALDEKESLRPDDSASVKAAEEDDSYSGPASGAPSSRVGSEAGSKAFRDQFYEISERIGPNIHRPFQASRRGIPGIAEEAPQLTLSPLTSTLPAPITLQRPEAISINGAPFAIEYQEPDEKLFEALESPKDRMFLLRLEQEVIAFVRDSTEPMIDLPPCNSFCRLLAHKLADYYALTHFVDNAVSSVRLYRTPYCRIPQPLSAISRNPAPADVVPFQPAVKIMRRSGLGKDGANADSGPNTTESSIVPSKAGSETGDDSQRGTGVASPTDSTAAKDKAAMTREEREAKYKETRERIFKGFEDADNNDIAAANETLIDVSRTSSVNEKKKTRKQRNNDDGFEARSKFNAYYPTAQYVGTTYDQTANPAAYYNPYAAQSNGQAGTLNPAILQGGYTQGFPVMPNTPAFPMAMQSVPAPNGSSFNGQAHSSSTFQIYNQQIQPQYFQPPQQPISMGQRSPAMAPSTLSSVPQLSRPQPQMPDQPWSQNPYPYLYQRQRDQQQFYPLPNPDQGTPATMPSVPYPYGQLPYQASLQGGRAQHPLPGSYNRQPFNPQTRAFVPGNGAMAPAAPYGGRANDSTAHVLNATYPTAMENGSHTLYSGSYAQMPVAPIPGPFNQVSDPKAYGNRKTSSQSNVPQSPVPNSLSKWGTPAHLPPKPPPPETPSLPEVQHSLPLNINASLNIQPLSNGQPMPSFQNGAYSMPGVGSQ